ncbi:unnamed protein product [Phytomonas sp. EM1]|nr:unnamed protein product [Phytomonas sp. EM1]|eukprot:CCW62894.1 unnamed protein product [Phytomonas sp. isolate EM1]
METVQELSKLLRLLDQLVNRMGARATPALARMMPVVWNKVLSAGELTAASPVVNMGVVSESARETIDVYRSFFHLLFSIATWGCAPALLLLPLPYLDSMLAQLAYAITLPAEVELPKFALQALTRLSEELLARKDVEGLPLDPCESATFAENLLYFRACLLERVLPATLQALLRPGFNLHDAKNFILIGEAGQFFKALCGVREQGEGGSNDASSPTQFDGEANPLADAALQAIYSGLKMPCEAGNTPNGCSNHGPEAVDPIMAFCVTLRAKPRFNLALKNELRCLLAAAQQKAC